VLGRPVARHLTDHRVIGDAPTFAGLVVENIVIGVDFALLDLCADVAQRERAVVHLVFLLNQEALGIFVECLARTRRQPGMLTTGQWLGHPRHRWLGPLHRRHRRLGPLHAGERRFGRRPHPWQAIAAHTRQSRPRIGSSSPCVLSRSRIGRVFRSSLRHRLHAFTLTSRRRSSAGRNLGVCWGVLSSGSGGNPLETYYRFCIFAVNDCPELAAEQAGGADYRT
jgi:hypothetical protein